MKLNYREDGDLGLIRRVGRQQPMRQRREFFLLPSSPSNATPITVRDA